MHNKKLNSGYEIPQLAVGTWKLIDKHVIMKVLDEAYKQGITHIDTASIYENEHLIGEFLKKHERRKFFITTKLWNNEQENVAKALEQSLRRLNTDYVDLYLIHWPVNTNGEFDVNFVWSQMEKLVVEKKARSIGVSNFGIENLKKLMNCNIKPAVNQIELHPYWPQDEVREFCEKYGILVEAYSPLGSQKSDVEKSVTKDEVICAIAKTYNATPQQVILSFLIQEGLVVITKTCSTEHLASNCKFINLKPEDIEKIKKIEHRCKYIDPVSFGKDRFK